MPTTLATVPDKCNGMQSTQLVHQFDSMSVNDRIKYQPRSSTEDELAVRFSQTLQLEVNEARDILTQKFDPYSAQSAPPKLLDCISLYYCPAVIEHAHDFPQLTVDWIKIHVFRFGQPYSAVLHEYEDITNSSIHWRAVLECGRELISTAHKAYNYPCDDATSGQTETYRGPSRSLEEFNARRQIWQVKEQVWNTIIEFANSPFQQRLNEIMVAGQGYDAALILEEKRGTFQPWEELAPTTQDKDRISHTRELPNPFDPILPGNMTMMDLARNEYA